MNLLVKILRGAAIFVIVLQLAGLATTLAWLDAPPVHGGAAAGFVAMKVALLVLAAAVVWGCSWFLRRNGATLAPRNQLK